MQNYADEVQFTMRHDEWLIKENISQLRQLMSDQNLQLLPDYEQRIEVLKELGFVDEKSRVELKGKVACEVRVSRHPHPTSQLTSFLFRLTQQTPSSSQN